MGEEIKHFSHEEHPLILSELQKENDQEKVVVCEGCGDPILDSAAYSCFPCKFFLHKRCAQLPLEITHPMHCQHSSTLVLRRNPPELRFVGWKCEACSQEWKLFSYLCSTSSCQFGLDVWCAKLAGEEIKHDCHEHPFIRLQKPATFSCDGCRSNHYKPGPSYLCTKCRFWIHKECGVLPATVKRKDHNHLLKLTYSIPSDSDYHDFMYSCPVCDCELKTSDWVYYCGRCRYFVHVKCVSEEGQLKDWQNVDNSKEEDDSICKENAVKLPTTHAAQKMITRFLLGWQAESSSNGSGKTNIPEKILIDSHEQHPLILSENMQNLDEIIKSSTSHQEVVKALLVCDLCTEPICSSDDLRYYACTECGYFVHLTCSKLPPELQIPHDRHHLSLKTDQTERVGFFKCNACGRPNNGACYNCKLCKQRICIKCASASQISSVAHDAHGKHCLTQFLRSKKEKSKKFEHNLFREDLCKACGLEIRDFGFACEDCEFYLCYECSVLPPETTQRWDKHPLCLAYPPYSDHPDEFYCVLCEQLINPQRWMYHCSECDYSLHPECVPQVGKFRRVKFGRSINMMDFHSHPLTFVLEAKYKSLCGLCNKSLDWDLAFECESCTYYLCLECFLDAELLILSGVVSKFTDPAQFFHGPDSMKQRQQFRFAFEHLQFQ